MGILSIAAPVAGRIIDLSAVPDPVFASKKMGDGFGLSQVSGSSVVAPVSGEVIMIAKTKHAIGIRADNGLEFLIHLGIDTVMLGGKPFDIRVSRGDRVEMGQQIATMDLQAIKSAGKDPTSIVIITNSAKLKRLTFDPKQSARAGEIAALASKVEPPKPKPEPVPEPEPEPEPEPTLKAEATSEPAPAPEAAAATAVTDATATGATAPDATAPDAGETERTAESDGDAEAPSAEGASGDPWKAPSPRTGFEPTITNEFPAQSAQKPQGWHSAHPVPYGPGPRSGSTAADVEAPTPSGAKPSKATPRLDPAALPSAAASLTGHEATAYDIIAGIGGATNVASVTHCITRVRFYLKDQSLADDAFIAEHRGVIDVIRAGGQYQVVIGPDVEDVYEAVERQLAEAGVATEDSGDQPAEDASSAEQERPHGVWGWTKHGFAQLIGVITGSMIPVIGLLAASGIIKGILSLLTTFDVITTDTVTYSIINAMSDAVFFFLPIFVGYTAARRLGADPIMVAIVGGVLTYPSMVELSSAEGTSSLMGMPLNADFFGLPFHMAGYTYSIFPIIVAAWLAARIEPWLKRIIPNTVRMIFVPLLEVVIVSLAILLILGPIVTFISEGIATGIQAIYDLSPTISGLIIGGFYQCLVIFGLHWAVIPLVAQDIAATGHSYLNAIISATMVAQGGAVLAIFVKSKLTNIKALAGPAAISAFCGITEPAMYGLNLKYGRAFFTASIGGAVGGLLTGIFNVNMWGFTGSLVGFSSFINPEGLDFSFWGFWIASAAAAGVAFALTLAFGFRDSDVDPTKARVVQKVRLGNREPVARAAD